MRYIIFAYPQYEPKGGWDDFIGQTNNIEELHPETKERLLRLFENDRHPIVDVIDTSTMSFDEQSEAILKNRIVLEVRAKKEKEQKEYFAEKRWQGACLLNNAGCGWVASPEKYTLEEAKLQMTEHNQQTGHYVEPVYVEKDGALMRYNWTEYYNTLDYDY